VNPLKAKVTERKECGRAVRLGLECADARTVAPGQFAHVLCDGGSERILRRPFSIFSQIGSRIDLLVRPVGGGSLWLAGRRPGDVLDLMLPLGKGFSEARGRCLLVAGGTGIAPLHLLARRAVEMEQPVELLWGLDCEDDYGELPLDLQEGLPLVLATCDGSAGFHGTAVDLLEMKLQSEKWDSVYACGPTGLLKKVAALLDAGMDCQMSMEERMACGIGACLGCAVPAAAPAGSYLHACSEGPVFDRREIDWGRYDQE
jgi:dihydroorotate dehydrogenase electron transfer subunit